MQYRISVIYLGYIPGPNNLMIAILTFWHRSFTFKF